MIWVKPLILYKSPCTIQSCTFKMSWSECCEAPFPFLFLSFGGWGGGYLCISSLFTVGVGLSWGDTACAPLVDEDDDVGMAQLRIRNHVPWQNIPINTQNNSLPLVLILALNTIGIELKVCGISQPPDPTHKRKRRRFEFQGDCTSLMNAKLLI